MHPALQDIVEVSIYITTSNVQIHVASRINDSAYLVNRSERNLVDIGAFRTPSMWDGVLSTLVGAVLELRATVYCMPKM